MWQQRISKYLVIFFVNFYHVTLFFYPKHENASTPTSTLLKLAHTIIRTNGESTRARIRTRPISWITNEILRPNWAFLVLRIEMNQKNLEYEPLAPLAIFSIGGVNRPNV